MGNSLAWCVSSTFHQINYFNSSFSDHSLLTCLTVFDHPTLEERYQGPIETTLEFAFTIDDFDDLVNPRHLYDCCLGLEPLAFVLKKIAREEKSRFDLASLFISLFFIRVKSSNLPLCRNGHQVH